MRPNRSSVTDIHTHLVFVTKYRRPAFTNSVLTRCEQIMREVCAGSRVELVEFNGEADHVHLLVRVPAAIALSNLVHHLKGRSSRLLRQQFSGHLRRYLWGGHLWSPSYYAGSVGGAPITVLRQYIESQGRPK
ncbi:MAG TPA: IS200/IS605 family transposase [Acidimicrobiales bacterium]|nr:IS200/IS605 family transposase [Acidimicrobiales bacterium]